MAIRTENTTVMEQISIIVPIYHGRKYINGMIAQIEECASVNLDKYTLELLFINDEPTEPIGSLDSDLVAIRVVETDINRGIHGARVRGLEHCKGDYVLFLDQDDRIGPEYFSSQLSHLGKNDVVVCKLLHEGRQFYDIRMPFEQVITKEYILSVRNPIISPGQVLLRKEKIPESWRNAKLQHNGADDWLLWLCMVAEDYSFALNPNILFEHVVEGENESINAAHMIVSEHEIYEVLLSAKAFSAEELEKLRGAVQAAAEGHIKLLSKFQKMFFIYDQWLRLQEEKKYLYEHLKKNGAYCVAIYGDSYIGKRLYVNLQGNGVEVKYFIDRNAMYLEEEIPVYSLQDELPIVDVIIISLVDETKEIREDLMQLSRAKICSIAELLAEIKNS